MPLPPARALLPLLGLFTLTACGGRTVLAGVGGYAEDAGADVEVSEASLPDTGRALDTGIVHDTGRPVTPDTGTITPCPPTDEVFALGSPCAWSGECSIDLDVCDAGDPFPTTCVCSGGAIELPPGTGIACSHNTGSSCPPGLTIGGACSGNVSCQTDYCGPGDMTTCTCLDGAWQCPEVNCLPLCGAGGACADGPCMAPDGCGSTVLCTCADGGTSCPVVDC